MTATIIQFSQGRFTPDDIGLINRVAGPRMDRGLWTKMDRECGSGGDFIYIYGCLMLPVIILERNKQGRYFLWFVLAGDLMEGGQGETMAEALRPYLQASAIRKKPAPRHA